MKNNTPVRHQQFEEIHSLIEFRKSRAYQAINYESIFTNWEVGKYVSAKIKSSEWGSKVVDSLAQYLKEKDPTIKGFSRRGIYRMVRFYDTYTEPEFVAALQPQIVSALQTQLQLTESKNNIFVSAMQTQIGSTTPIQIQPNTDEFTLVSFLAQIPWYAHLEILSGCVNAPERIFYMLTTINERLDYRTLGRQIDAGIYERTLIGNNKQSETLKTTYPTAKNYFKDSYMVDFLNLPEHHNEKTLQKGLVEQMKKFVLDLGNDFIFVDDNFRLQVGMDDFYLDLLFFHRGLQCFVAIELKTTKFKPEYLGQLDFYLEALDRDVRKANENPSIGILLCKDANEQVVEYALSRSLSPTMIAEYKRQLIPKEILQQNLHFLEQENNDEN
ncbi:MAG: PDDEXK nuclease domain-containing protein [Bacteroidales bacterium]|nr:PDDEXK nuclease domain-containing protein [Bacteroidales bacterium]